MLERGQGLYFTPKRARKFKVEAVCNLSPGPQQGTYVDTAPQPHVWEPGGHHHCRTGRDGFLPSPRSWQPCAPCQREIAGITPLPPTGNEQGSANFSSSDTLLHTYTKGGWQTLKKANPSSYFGNSAWTSSVILSKKGSYKYIFLSGSTTDRIGQILLIETQEIFSSSGLQSPVLCCPKKADHIMLLINYLASS